MRYLLALTLALAVSFLWHGMAAAGDLPRGTGHIASEHKRLYDEGCCNAMRCESVPDSAIHLTGDGVKIEYMSPINGHVLDVVPYGDSRLRNSKGCYDGMCQHVCSIADETCTYGIGFSASCKPTGKPAKVECAYLATTS